MSVKLVGRLLNKLAAIPSLIDTSLTPYNSSVDSFDELQLLSIHRDYCRYSNTLHGINHDSSIVLPRRILTTNSSRLATQEAITQQ